MNPRWTERFADFGARVWLDTAHTGPLPRAALEAGRAALSRKHEPWRMQDEDYFALPARVRSLGARLFGCEPERVALTNGAGAGTNVVARGIHWEPHDKVVLPPGEFPSNLFPWLWLEQREVEVFEPAPDDASGAVSAEALAEAIDERTKVVAFSLVSYRHAGRLDPAPIVAAARAHGALVVIDASQAAGAEPLALEALGADVVVAAGYKFLLGPYGVGLAAFSERALSELAVGDLNWWSVEGASDFNKLPGRGFRLVPGAMRWDAHETAAFVQLSTFAASLELVLEADPARTGPHCRALCDALLEGLPAGYHAASPLDEERRSHMLALRAADPGATAAAHASLAEAGVFVSQRADRLRVAPHFFNDEADVERLLEALPRPAR